MEKSESIRHLNIKLEILERVWESLKKRLSGIVHSTLSSKCLDTKTTLIIVRLIFQLVLAARQSGSFWRTEQMTVGQLERNFTQVMMLNDMARTIMNDIYPSTVLNAISQRLDIHVHKMDWKIKRRSETYSQADKWKYTSQESVAVLRRIVKCPNKHRLVTPKRAAYKAFVYLSKWECYVIFQLRWRNIISRVFPGFDVTSDTLIQIRPKSYFSLLDELLRNDTSERDRWVPTRSDCYKCLVLLLLPVLLLV